MSPRPDQRAAGQQAHELKPDPSAISIICLLWQMLFSSFRPEGGTTQRRALIWEATHLPLHFGLLLLLAAVVVSAHYLLAALVAESQNVVIVLAYVGGIDLVSQEFVAMIKAIDSHEPLSPSDQMSIQPILTGYHSPPGEWNPRAEILVNKFHEND